MASLRMAGAYERRADGSWALRDEPLPHAPFSPHPADAGAWPPPHTHMAWLQPSHSAVGEDGGGGRAAAALAAARGDTLPRHARPADRHQATHQQDARHLHHRPAPEPAAASSSLARSTSMPRCSGSGGGGLPPHLPPPPALPARTSSSSAVNLQTTSVHTATGSVVYVQSGGGGGGPSRPPASLPPARPSAAYVPGLIGRRAKGVERSAEDLAASICAAHWLLGLNPEGKMHTEREGERAAQE